MTKNELYNEILIAKNGEWVERFNQLTQLYFDTYGVCYWFHEEEKAAESFELNNNRARKMGSKLASQIKPNDVIIVNTIGNGKGKEQTLVAEKVVTVENVSNHFILVNGQHKMKKSTYRSTFLGYAK